MNSKKQKMKTKNTEVRTFEHSIYEHSNLYLIRHSIVRLFDCSNVQLFAICYTLYLCLSSCSDSPFPDFTETKNGLFYKLQDVGDGERKATPGDYVTAQIIIKSENDSVLFDTRKMGLDGSVTFILPPVEYAKDYREGFQYLSEGDSAVFITDVYTLFIKKNHSAIPTGVGMNLASVIRVETKVLKIYTPKEYSRYMFEEEKKLEQGEFEEKKKLVQYLANNGIVISPIANGMYYIPLFAGEGHTLDSARSALINYKGYFLNGRCFDSNYENQPFEYVIGAEEQLIKGLENGVRRMREGAKAKFIIPSHLAFGSSGSSSGIVPPFTTVIYEVELLKVQ